MLARVAIAVLLAVAASLSFAASAASTEPTSSAVESGAADEFVPLDQSARPTVSGKQLVIAAYAVILGLVLAYSLWLLVRERAVFRDVASDGGCL